jgi:hypothetical protein
MGRWQPLPARQYGAQSAFVDWQRWHGTCRDPPRAREAALTAGLLGLDARLRVTDRSLGRRGFRCVGLNPCCCGTASSLG